MKRLLSLITLALSIALGAAAQTTGYLTGDNVCMRSVPNEGGKMTGPNNHHFFKGDVVDVYGSVGNYYKIKYGGQVRYLPKKYVQLGNAHELTTAGCPPYIVIAGDNVCLRSQATESTKMTGSDKPHLFTGEVYPCLGMKGNYYLINYNNGRYYIPKQYGRPRYPAEKTTQPTKQPAAKPVKKPETKPHQKPVAPSKTKRS